MKIAVLSEFSTEELAIRILVEAILGEKSEEVSLEKIIRARGVNSVFSLLPVALIHAHYQTEAEALVVVVDSDETEVHLVEHHNSGSESARCRLCKLRQISHRTIANLKPLLNKPIIKTAFGLAVPSVEAWYLCGINPHVNEVTWIRKLNGEQIPYSKESLKSEIYQKQPIGRQEKEGIVLTNAERLANNIGQLEDLFPNGFGCLANDIRGW